MINILLSGANGKMGQAVTRLAEESDQVQISAGFDINTEQKAGFPVYDDLSRVQEPVDVIIDFSHPAMLDNILNYAAEEDIPAVICTTGLTTEQVSRIEYEAQNIPLFFSANMSLGVNLLIDLVCRAAKILENNFDIEIIEKHHNQKLDAPSGTALAIANALADTLSYPAEYVYDRHSVRKKRDKARDRYSRGPRRNHSGRARRTLRRNGRGNRNPARGRIQRGLCGWCSPGGDVFEGTEARSLCHEGSDRGTVNISEGGNIMIKTITEVGYLSDVALVTINNIPNTRRIWRQS